MNLHPRNSRIIGLLLTLCICLIISCGNSIKNAQDFIPNKGPVITQFVATDLNGNQLDAANIVNNMQIKIIVEASDPEKKPLSYVFSSDKGSFTDLSITDTGCTIYCFTQSVIGGKDVIVNLSVRDQKDASATTSLNIGTGKQGPLLTVNSFSADAIKSSGSASFTFTSTCDGYYRIVEASSIASTVEAKALAGPIFQYTASLDSTKPAIITVSAAGADSQATSDIRLLSTEGTKKIWIVFWDELNQYDYNFVPLIVDNTQPVISSHIPGTGETGVPSSTNVSFTFAENDDINTDTLPGALSISPSTGITIGAPAYSGKTANYTVTGISPDTIYTAVLAASVTDRAGNGLDVSATNNRFRFANNIILVTGITLDETSLVMQQDDAVQLTATLTPPSVAQAVTWSSSNTNVATVGANGNIYAENCGSARITATAVDGGDTVSCDVRVDPATTFSRTANGATMKYTIPSGGTFETVTTPSLASGSTFPTGRDDSVPSPVPAQFSAAKTETTWALWFEVYGWATGDYGNGKRSDGGALYKFANTGNNGYSGSGINMPVTTISWNDAMIWCNALTEYYNATNGGAADLDCVYTFNGEVIRDATSANLPGCLLVEQVAAANGFRLLTCNEWEFAARYIGTSLPSHSNYILSGGIYYYKGISASGATASVSPTEGSTGPTSIVALFSVSATVTPEAVGIKAANSLGLYDMTGNVWEWCFDWAADNTYFKRTQRGGSSGDNIASQTDRLMLYYKDAVPYSSTWWSYGLRFCKNP